MENLLKLVPEKYQNLVKESKWSDCLQKTFEVLSQHYIITEIVPACLEEFIQLNARDLVVDDIAEYSTIDVHTMESLLYCIKKDIPNFYCHKTSFEGTIHDCEHPFYSKYEGIGHGWKIVKSDDDIVYYGLNRLSEQKHTDYKVDWYFKVRGKDFKKITIDKPTLSYLKSVLNEEEYPIVKRNFRILNSNGEIKIE